MTIRKICSNSLASIALAISFFASAAFADKPELVFRLGLDSLTHDQSDISGVSGMSLLVVNQRGFYFGESIYSAALGQGGGFFVGGVELGKYTPVGERYFWDASLFIGGGGGASQVPGNGLMLRPQLQFGVVTERYRIGAGVAYTHVSGSNISTPSFGISLSRPLDLALVNGAGQQGGLAEFSAMRVSYRPYIQLNSSKRGGAPLQTMQLIGAEMVFAKTIDAETFIMAHGAVAGDAEGYADWVLGQRFFLGEGALRAFGEVGAGVGGGGAVDSGGGLIATVGAGVRWQPGRVGIELGVNAIGSVNGHFLAVSPALKVGLQFGGGRREATQTHWQISSGITQQFPNANFRKDGVANQGSPLMIDTKIDLFLNEHIYFSGQAYTALAGGAGGYQIGLVGLGLRHRMSPRWTISAEVFLGAGGGAGVDTRGGLLMAYAVDLDYLLLDTMYVTVGAGQVATLQDGGMAPLTANIGLKFPFSTLH